MNDEKKRKLKFYARTDLLFSEPYDWRIPGQPARYVGRKFDPKTRGYPATLKPAEYEVGSNKAERIIKRMRFDNPPPLFAADEYTAEMCGVEYEAPVYMEGAWVDAFDYPDSEEQGSIKRSKKSSRKS